MVLKELTVKETLQLLADKYPEPVEVYVWSDEAGKQKKRKATLDTICVRTNDGLPYPALPFVCCGELYHQHCAIEVHEYRYMTHQEHGIWLVTTGHRNHQMRLKTNAWVMPFDLIKSPMSEYEYRTVEMIDGKIVYGEPQEFKVKV